ncbi:MAG: hypothetical protein AABY98_04385, partial [Candidatus Deferrimicrobiota bacterium]
MNPTIREVSAISIHSARNWNAQPREAMISITGTDEPRVSLKKGWAFTLRLCFDDIEEPRFGRTLFSDGDADNGANRRGTTDLPATEEEDPGGEVAMQVETFGSEYITPEKNTVGGPLHMRTKVTLIVLVLLAVLGFGCSSREDKPGRYVPMQTVTAVLDTKTGQVWAFESRYGYWYGTPPIPDSREE